MQLHAVWEVQNEYNLVSVTCGTSTYHFMSFIMGITGRASSKRSRSRWARVSSPSCRCDVFVCMLVELDMKQESCANDGGFSTRQAFEHANVTYLPWRQALAVRHGSKPMLSYQDPTGNADAADPYDPIIFVQLLRLCPVG
jgi:hypothetical protein